MAREGALVDGGTYVTLGAPYERGTQTDNVKVTMFDLGHFSSTNTPIRSPSCWRRPRTVSRHLDLPRICNAGTERPKRRAGQRLQAVIDAHEHPLMVRIADYDEWLAGSRPR
jgi:hypothetical protein